MKLTNEVWGKVLKLKSKYEKESKILSRDKLAAELQGVCSEHNARVLHEMLQNLHVLLRHTGAASEARLLDKLVSLNSKNKELRDELGRLNKVVDLVNNVSKQETDSPEWLVNKSQTKTKQWPAPCSLTLTLTKSLTLNRSMVSTLIIERLLLNAFKPIFNPL